MDDSHRAGRPLCGHRGLSRSGSSARERLCVSILSGSPLTFTCLQSSVTKEVDAGKGGLGALFTVWAGRASEL